jgi:very-short-patch-repair endonuclease
VTNIKKITKSHRQRLLITFKCECGNTFNHVFKGINGYKTKIVCSECSKIRRGKNKRRKYTDNYNLLTSMGYNILSDIKGIKNTEKIKVMDKDGYIGYTTIASALRARGFEKYSVRNNKENYIYNINVFLKNKGFKSKAIDFLEQNPKSRFPQIKLQCECGNYFNGTVNNICCFKTRCCNCARKMSTYESMTNDFLKEQNIGFLREYGFNDCVDVQKLLFDFYLKDYKAIIEVDGRQHYVPTNFGNCEKTTQEIFEDIQRHDKIKNEYCRKNNIPLLRIPYWEFKTDNYKQLIIDFLSRINES